MKAILSMSIIVTGFLLSLLVPGSAQAQPVTMAMGTCTHEATVASLRLCVRHAANQGFIDNQGITRSLLAKLDAAQAAVERGQPVVATKILAAFVRQVEAQTGKHIASPHAEHLVMHAAMVIEALQR